MQPKHTSVTFKLIYNSTHESDSADVLQGQWCCKILRTGDPIPEQ